MGRPKQLLGSVHVQKTTPKLQNWRPPSSQGAVNLPWTVSGLSLLLRRFVFRKVVMSRKGPWEGYRRQATPVVSFPPYFARARETSGFVCSMSISLSFLAPTSSIDLNSNNKKLIKWLRWSNRFEQRKKPSWFATPSEFLGAEARYTKYSRKGQCKKKWYETISDVVSWY